MLHQNGYSSKVDLSLEVAGINLSVAQVCPDCLYLSEPAATTPPTMATLTIQVDGTVEKSNIFLMNGIQDGLQVAYY